MYYDIAQSAVSVSCCAGNGAGEEEGVFLAETSVSFVSDGGVAEEERVSLDELVLLVITGDAVSGGVWA
ncbi:hypothetical protein [Coleofasciculus sp. F4-SAH-05]|uniref:hypothetical protein n=1 Tax=Coleofasciculus sp. F4-SAH-05 TaxID=3069525 RepID=UPI0040630BBA